MDIVDHFDKNGFCGMRLKAWLEWFMVIGSEEGETRWGGIADVDSREHLLHTHTKDTISVYLLI